MEVTVQIPDDLAATMRLGGNDLSRRALEALAVGEFRSGHISKPELRRLLNLDTRYQVDSLLRTHGLFEDYTLEDLEHELEGLTRLGI